MPTGLRHSIVDEDDPSASSGQSEGEVNLEWDETPDAQAYELLLSTAGEANKTIRLTETKYLLLQQKRGQPYKYALRTICDATSQSQWTTTNTFELKENAWISDPNLTYTPDMVGTKLEDRLANKTEETKPEDDSTGSSTEEGTETESTETTPEESPYSSEDDKAIEGLFSEPVTVLVPLDPTNTDTTTTPRELTVLPTNPTVEQLQTALKKQKPKCAGLVAAYSCGSHDGVPQYIGATITYSFQ